MNSIAWVYLPYFAFLGVVIAGLHYKNMWVVGLGIAFFMLYNVKKELKIICKRPIYNNCTFENIKEQNK